MLTYDDEEHKKTIELHKEKLTLSQKLDTIEKQVEIYLNRRKQHEHAVSIKL